MPQQRVRFEQFFAAPQDRVFAWFARHENFSKLFPGQMKRLQPAPEGQDPDGKGARFEFRLLGLRLEETITEFDPPRRIEYRVLKGWPMRNHLSRLSFEPVEGGTQLEFVAEFDSVLPFAGNLLAATLCKRWHRGTQRAIEEITGDTPS